MSIPLCKVAILKIASRCNLNCSYCYMYNLADKSFMDQPRVISESTTKAFAKRLATHCAIHKQKNVVVVLHGGEPLLAGRKTIGALVDQVKTEFDGTAPDTEVVFSLQTNGTPITDEWCVFFKEKNIKIGVSIDGPREVHDKNRVFHSGKGSHSRVMRGWDLLKTHGLEPSVLTVINLFSDPVATFDFVHSLQPSRADFLLPECTHDNPPLRLAPGRPNTEYADWLIPVFERWTAANAPFRVILFEYIARKILGGVGTYDALGPDENPNLIFETDGSIEPVDVLKACKHGMTKTSFNVHTHEIEDCFSDPMIGLYYRGGDGACADCKKCAIFDICGGGYLPHRYSEKNGFDNVSVYCNDLQKIICHIQNHVVDSLPSEVIDRIEIRRLEYS